jgi:hypothetical protein
MTSQIFKKGNHKMKNYRVCRNEIEGATSVHFAINELIARGEIDFEEIKYDISKEDLEILMEIAVVYTMKVLDSHSRKSPLYKTAYATAGILVNTYNERFGDES